MTNYFERLIQANNVLDGYTKDRSRKTHAGFTGEGVISLLEGGASRRPDVSLINQLLASLYQHDRFPIESYTNYDVLPGLIDKIQERFLGWNVLPSLTENIALTNGSIQALNAFLNSVCKAGDTVLTTQGFYHPFASIPHRNHIHMACVPTSKANSYKLTAADLEAFMLTYTGTAPKAILLTNSTLFGACYTQQELQELAIVIKARKLLVYEDAVFKGTEHSASVPAFLLASVPGMESHVVLASSISKVFNSANVRLGWACGPEFVINRMVSYMRDESTTISQFSQIAALAAMQMPEGFVADNIAEIRKRVALVTSLVAEINTALSANYTSRNGKPFMAVEVTPHSGHSLLLNLEGLAGLHTPSGYIIQDDLDIARYLLEHGVGVSPTYSCGFLNGYCVRIALAEIDVAPARKAVHQYELHQGIQHLLELAAPARSQQIWQHIAPQLGGEVTRETMESNVQSAFTEVRQTLAFLFQQRVQPALEELLKHNSLLKSEDKKAAA